eukprot:gene6489-biopygen1152
MAPVGTADAHGPPSQAFAQFVLVVLVIWGRSRDYSSVNQSPAPPLEDTADATTTTGRRALPLTLAPLPLVSERRWCHGCGHIRSFGRRMANDSSVQGGPAGEAPSCPLADAGGATVPLFFPDEEKTNVDVIVRVWRDLVT